MMYLYIFWILPPPPSNDTSRISGFCNFSDKSVVKEALQTVDFLYQV